MGHAVRVTVYSIWDTDIVHVTYDGSCLVKVVGYGVYICVYITKEDTVQKRKPQSHDLSPRNMFFLLLLVLHLLPSLLF